MADTPSFRPDPAFTVACDILGRSRVEFTHHAEQRMKERRVTVEQVIDAISFPDETGLPADQQQVEGSPPRHRVRKLYGGAALDVVYEEWPDAIVIVSVYPRTRRLGGRF